MLYDVSPSDDKSHQKANGSWVLESIYQNWDFYVGLYYTIIEASLANIYVYALFVQIELSVEELWLTIICSSLQLR